MITAIANHAVLNQQPLLLVSVFILEFILLPICISAWCGTGLFKVYFSEFRFYSVLNRWFIWPTFGLMITFDAIASLILPKVDLTATIGFPESVLVIATSIYTLIGFLFLPFVYFSLKHRIDPLLHPILGRRSRMWSLILVLGITLNLILFEYF